MAFTAEINTITPSVTGYMVTATFTDEDHNYSQTKNFGFSAGTSQEDITAAITQDGQSQLDALLQMEELQDIIGQTISIEESK